MQNEITYIIAICLYLIMANYYYINIHIYLYESIIYIYIYTYKGKAEKLNPQIFDISLLIISVSAVEYSFTQCEYLLL